MKVNAVKGMNDYLPGEVELRDYIQSTILRVYEKNDPANNYDLMDDPHLFLFGTACG